MDCEDNETLRRQVYQAAPIGLCFFDTDLRYRYINEWLASINGLSVEAHLGRTIREVVPDVSAAVEPLLRRVMETGEPVLDGIVEVATPASSNETRTFQHSYNIVRSDDDTVMGVSCIVQDVTELKRTQDHLTASRERYFDLYDNAPDMFCSVDAQTGQILECNSTLARATGYSKDALKALSHVSRLYHPDCEEARRGVYHTFATEGTVRDAELQLLRNDGSALDVSLNISSVRDENGRIIRSRSIWRDITSRKRTEQALVDAANLLEERVRTRTEELTRSELRQRLLLESTRAVPWVADAATSQFTYVGPQAARLLGYPQRQWLEADFWTSHLHPEDREVAIDARVQSTKAKADYDFEYRVIAADGRTVWIHDIVSVEPHSGAPQTLRGFMIDITERKEAQQNFGRLLEATPDPMIIINQTGTIDLVNVQTERVFGFDRLELIGQSVDMLLPTELRAQHVHHREHYLSKPEVRRMGSGLDLLAVHKDGHTFPVDVSLSPCQTSEGLFVISCIRDISEQRQAQEELRRNRNELRVLAGRLISAHEDERRRIARELHDDLSQRLAAIAMDAAMLEGELRPVTEAGSDNLAKLSDRIRRCSADVHQISRQLHPSIVDELGLVKAIQAECDTFERRSGIAVRFEGPAEYGSVAPSTELALYRILQECLRNVEKHSRAVAARIDLSANDAEMSLTIADSGAGFDPTQQREDHGLGLASLKERVGLLGGTISIQSEVGRGTTVIAQLPVEVRE